MARGRGLQSEELREDGGCWDGGTEGEGLGHLGRLSWLGITRGLGGYGILMIAITSHRRVFRRLSDLRS
jgi:hypothetical protein